MISFEEFQKGCPMKVRTVQDTFKTKRCPLLGLEGVEQNLCDEDSCGPYYFIGFTLKAWKYELELMRGP